MKALKIIGLLILGIGVVVEYGNLRGWFLYPERQAFLKWILESVGDMPVEQPAAQAFILRFSPPDNARLEEITQIEKFVMRLQRGGVSIAQFRYVYRDGSRTAYVATLAEIREWVAETTYPWLAWSLTLVGFLAVLATTALELKPAIVSRNT